MSDTEQVERFGWEPGQVRVVTDERVEPEVPQEFVLGVRAWVAQIELANMSGGGSDEFAMPDDLADYWIHGKGAAKIRWCTEGAFERARRALREHVPAPMLNGTVANLYKRACGKWPGQDRD